MYYTKVAGYASRHTSTAISKALPVVFFIVIMYAIWKVVTFLKVSGATITDNLTSKATEKTVTAATGVDHSTYKNMETIAEQIHGFLHDSAFDEDEDSVKNALSPIKTVDQVKALSNIYKIKYDKSLKLDIEKYFTYFDFWGFPEIVRKNYF